MQIGYALVSTKDQNFDLQIDALRKAGCEKVFQEVVSGAKAERPVFDGLLRELRSGDVLVIWKLDRLGRSLRHLVELAGTLMEQNVGLRSLNDPIDTTTPQGRLAFNLFASLAYPNTVAAKRAIADYLNVPLAKLSAEAMDKLDAALAESLRKADVIDYARINLKPLLGG